ncbi:MAG: PAS domain-containing protein [Gammaproteobacteria bacterium]
MKRFSLSVKLTIISILISALILVLLYFGFTHIVKQHLLKVEKEKAEIIANTIEPMIAMNAFLGLSDENIQLATQTKKNSDVVGVAITIDNKMLVDDKLQNLDGLILTEKLIYDPLTAEPVGKLEIQYVTDAYKEAAEEINQNVLYQLGYISIAFLLFGLLVRYFMRPLGLIAEIVSNYKPGEELAFSGVRMEPEISAISNAFKRMLKTLDEHNLLLERYKLSIDESSIVSRINPSGQITYVNDEFCKVSGYDRKELINSSSKFYQDIWNDLYNKKIWKGTVKNETKNGEPYYVKSTIVPILDESGDILEFVTIQHDVTQIIKQKEQISRQITDPVTGLKNRVKLIEDLQSVDKCCLAILSVDNYNVIKDYYGYETGIDIIVKLSNKIKSLIHNDDLNLYKLASNEFAILSANNDLDSFSLQCRELIEIIEDSNINLSGENFDIHMSAGISNTLENLTLYASFARR